MATDGGTVRGTPIREKRVGLRNSMNRAIARIDVAAGIMETSCTTNDATFGQRFEGYVVRFEVGLARRDL